LLSISILLYAIVLLIDIKEILKSGKTSSLKISADQL